MSNGKRRRKPKGDEDASTLNYLRLGMASREDGSAAASRLGKKLAAARGTQYMAEIGKRGASSYWSRMSPLEKKLEIRRRAAVRVRNRKAAIQKRIAEANEAARAKYRSRVAQR